MGRRRQFLVAALRIMARLSVEPRPSEYVPGALPIELPSLGYKVDCLSITNIVADWTSNMI